MVNLLDNDSQEEIPDLHGMAPSLGTMLPSARDRTKIPV